MSGPLLGLPAAVDDVYKGLNNFTLLSHFAWAGKAYPFAGTSDLTISSNTTWDDVAGFKKIRKLTINAGVTLKIDQTPFIIFADEIECGAGAVIDISGPNGASSGDFTCRQPHGATAVSGGARAQGGCGGGFLVLLCNKLSGVALTIKANGGDGWRNNTTGSSDTPGVGLEGAFSRRGSRNPQWNGSDRADSGYLNLVGIWLGEGGGRYSSVTGMSSGGAPGSGIGGGGGAELNDAGDGTQMDFRHILILLELLKYGCLGGGGGKAYVSSSSNRNPAAGGGGGAILVFANDPESITPIMEANGGLGVTGSAVTVGNGAAGITYYVNFAE